MGCVLVTLCLRESGRCGLTRAVMRGGCQQLAHHAAEGSRVGLTSGVHAGGFGRRPAIGLTMSVQPCNSQQAGQQCVCGAPGVFGVEAVQVDGVDISQGCICVHACPPPWAWRKLRREASESGSTSLCHAMLSRLGAQRGTTCT
jgi:hypothetical protein